MTPALNVMTGAHLPLLLRHHMLRRELVSERCWPIRSTDGATPKPGGGMWASPVVQPYGKWRPYPLRSAWGAYCHDVMPHRVGGYQTPLRARNSAMFLVIDSADDLAAAYAAFPVRPEDHPLAQMLAAAPVTMLNRYARTVDWAQLPAHGLAGVWLTAKGLSATRHLNDDEVPALWSWDCASVWFAQRDAAVVAGPTRSSPHVAFADEMAGVDPAAVMQWLDDLRRSFPDEERRIDRLRARVRGGGLTRGLMLDITALAVAAEIAYG